MQTKIKTRTPLPDVSTRKNAPGNTPLLCSTLRYKNAEYSASYASNKRGSYRAKLIKGPISPVRGVKHTNELGKTRSIQSGKHAITMNPDGYKPHHWLHATNHCKCRPYIRNPSEVGWKLCPDYQKYIDDYQKYMDSRHGLSSKINGKAPNPLFSHAQLYKQHQETTPTPKKETESNTPPK